MHTNTPACKQTRCFLHHTQAIAEDMRVGLITASPRPCGVDMAMDHWLRPLSPRRNPRHDTLVAEGAFPVIAW